MALPEPGTVLPTMADKANKCLDKLEKVPYPGAATVAKTLKGFIGLGMMAKNLSEGKMPTTE